MYKKHTAEEYNQVISLRKDFGWGITKIHSFLFEKGIHIKKGAIGRWIYKNGKIFDEVLTNKILEKSKQLTKEKAYILGVLCGDGYIRIQKKSHGYLVGLDVIDEDFADEFRICLKKVYGLLPSKNLRIRKITNFTKNAKPKFVINLTSKLVIEDLLRYSQSFKTKEWKIPEQIKVSSLGIKSSFLKGLFDSEGTIRMKKKGHAYLQLCSGNTGSLIEVMNMLKEDFGVRMGIRLNSQGVMIIYCERYDSIKNFSEKVGFVINRKKEKLEFCVDQYKRKGLRSYDKQFRLKCLKLLEEGYSAYKIGKMLDLPYTNVYDFIKQFEKGTLKDGRFIHC